MRAPAHLSWTLLACSSLAVAVITELAAAAPRREPSLADPNAGDPRREDNLDDEDDPVEEPTATALTVEAGLYLPDLRRLRDVAARQRQRLSELPLWRAYLAADEQGQGPLDVAAELERLLLLAGHAAASVPFIVVVLSGEDGLHWQASLPVADGLDERLAAASAGRLWRIEHRPDEYALTIGETRVLGRRVGGWLRFGDAPATIGFVAAPPTLRRALTPFTEGEDVVLFVSGGGRVADTLRGELDSPQAAMVLATTRDLVVSYKSDGDRSARVRLLVDADALAQLGPLVRPRELRDALSPRLGPDVTTLVSLALPQAALPTALMLAQGAFGGERVPPMPAELQESLAALTGRATLALFGSPFDWALGVAASDEAHAAAVTPALGRWLARLTTALAPALAGTATLAPLAPTGQQALLLTPDPAIDAVRVLDLGDNVLAVAQRRRAELIVTPPTKDAPPPPLAGPLTDMVRATVARPALVTGYTLLGGNGALVYGLGWAGKGLEVALQGSELAGKLSPATRALLYRLPLALGVVGASSMLVYDAALSLDVQGTVLLLEVSTSEI